MTYLENLVWMDLEMTGLDPETNRIIEIATIITDAHLNIIEEGPILVLKQPQNLLDSMDDWNTKHHTASGLIDRMHTAGITEIEAEQITLDFIQRHVKPGKAPLCGNSIAQDRRFLVKYMPMLTEYLHYRDVDVSTIKELARRWAPDIYDGVVKKNTHRALDDVRESIEELKYYQARFFKT